MFITVKKRMDVFLAIGLIVLSATLIITHSIGMPHELSLFLLGAAVALEIFGVFRMSARGARGSSGLARWKRGLIARIKGS